MLDHEVLGFHSMSLYSRILENTLLPLYNRVRGRDYAERRRFLEASQWWAREQLLEFQWRELKALLAHVFTTVPYYQKKYAAAGIALEDIRTPQDFSRLPPLTRQEIQEHREELCSPQFSGKLLPKATGGSTGVPTRFYITLASFDWRTAATERAYAWTGCRLGERAAYLWGAPIGDVPRLKAFKERAYYSARRQLILNTFAQSEDRWNEIYHRICRYKPRLLVGYVSSLEGFSRFLLGKRLRVPGIRAVIAAAEPVFPATRELVERAVGAPLFNTYGSREFMSIGGECDRHGAMHINAENILLETVHPPSSGPSEILITDLHNFGMPFVRYLIGDVGVLTEAPCSCGRSLPLLRSVDGRILDAFRTADGRVVAGELFPHLMKEIPEVLEFQAEQKSLDRILLRAVLSAELSQGSREVIQKEMRKAFGDSTRLEIERVESIPRLPSGKRRVTIGLP